jgi:3-oxoacyl-[acyl-carrier-protein] synthase-3
MSSLHGSRAAIEAVATCADAGAGSRALAIRAARAALESAHRGPEEVELLVSAGVFRDENIVEPAIGPFIQRGIGANTSFPPTHGGGTFSFDLANGACGPITAINVIDGFIRSGAVRSAMVVASDADPDPGGSESYPYAAAAGAILLRASSNGEGFAWFHARTWSEHFALYEARLCGTEDMAAEARPRTGREQRLRVSARADFLERGLDCARRTIAEAVEHRNLDLAEVDLLIPVTEVAAVAEGIAAALGLAGVPTTPPAGADRTVHTASTAFALERAQRDGSWARARRILFVAIGAGVTVSLALYQHDPRG